MTIRLVEPADEGTSTIGRFGPQLVVDRPDHDRFDLWQRLEEQGIERAHGGSEHEHRAEIERIDAGRCGAHLTGGAADHFPGRNPVRRARRVEDVRALRAG